MFKGIFKDKGFFTHMPFTNDTIGPVLAQVARSIKREDWELSWVIFFESRKRNSWFKVWPLAPTASKFKEIWSDDGENTNFSLWQLLISIRIEWVATRTPNYISIFWLFWENYLQIIDHVLGRGIDGGARVIVRVE